MSCYGNSLLFSGAADTVYDADGKAVYPAESLKYMVRVSIKNINIRKGQGIAEGWRLDLSG